MKQYPFPDDFFKMTTRHCAALFIQRIEAAAQPATTTPNATITYVEYKGATYGVTCAHVLETLREKNAEAGSPANFAFYTHVAGSHILRDAFTCPKGDYLIEPPDIALSELPREYLEGIGKTPMTINIDTDDAPPLDEIEHATVVGFPTAEKEEVEGPLGRHIAMKAYHVVAELNSIDKTRRTISFHSVVEQQSSAHSFNGMSGGPIFWSTENSYGILGIMAEERAAPKGDPNIVAVGVLATPKIIAKWIDEKLESA